MSNLFKKAAVFTDIHWGNKNNSMQFNQDCMDFVDWFIETAKQEKCETCLFLGDWHNNRSSLNLQTLQFSIRALEKLNIAFSNVFFLPGNHDLYYRDRRDVHGVEWAKHLSNIHVIDDWFTEGDVSIVPWLCGNDHRRIINLKTHYVFGHFELPHFKLNSQVVMPDHGGLQLHDFDNVAEVYSGHFHVRQHNGKIHYIGNAFPHNFSDEGDDERGCMILEWGKTPVFKKWENQPLYKILTLSKLINEPDKVLKQNMSVKVRLDINISYEEANFIKETFIKTHNIREISLLPETNRDLDQESVEITEFHSVDQIIQEQLSSVTSETYDPKLLMSIYENL